MRTLRRRDRFTENQRSDYIRKIARTHDAGLIARYATRADHYATARNICIGAAAALYLYNLIDVVAAPGARRLVIGGRTPSGRTYAVAPAAFPVGAVGFSAAATFWFVVNRILIQLIFFRLMRTFRSVFIALLCGALFGGCSEDEIPSFGGVYGVVSDVRTGEPVRAASMVLSPGNLSTTTGQDGHYEFSDLEAGQYKLQVQASGYETNSRQVVVTPGQNASGDITLRPVTEMSGVQLSTTSLNFGTNLSELTFSIRNVGTSGIVDWSITGISVGWLSLDPMSGQTEMGKESSVRVKIDRSGITADEETTFFTVNAAGGSQSVMVQVGSGNGDEPGGEDNPGGDDQPTGDVTNGLYAYYTFEGDTGNTVDGAPDATAINSPSFVDGMKGLQAIKFSVADNSFISVPETIIDRGTFTLSFWAKGLGDGHIFHVPSSGRYGESFVMTMKNGALTYMTSGYDLEYQYEQIESFLHGTLDASKWYMVTLTSSYKSVLQETEVQLYIDGRFVDTRTEEHVPQQTMGYGVKFIFGGKLEYFPNKEMTSPSLTIDNLRIYNSRVLSAVEVKQIYNYEK